MRVAFASTALALSLPIGGCQLPRPHFAPDQSASCRLSGSQPTGDAQLFVTLRRPDCSGPVLLTNFRSEIPRYASITEGAIQFHELTPWLAALDRRITANPNIQPVLYIHGYNTSNAEAVARSGEIAEAIAGRDAPVVAVTWPSYASKTSYLWDEANAEWAGEGAANVLATLTARLPKLIVIAHSMGNRLALDAVQALDAGTRAEEVQRLVMASPDVDRETVMRRLSSPGQDIDTTIYVSLKDQALSGSWRGHGYARAGDFSWWVSGRKPYFPFAWLPKVEIVDTTEVDDRSLLRFNIGHTAFISTRAGRADLCRLARGDGKGRPGLKPIEALSAMNAERNNYFELVDTAANDGCDQGVE